MKNNRNDSSITEIEAGGEHGAEASTGSRTKRSRTVIMHILLFLACLLISTGIWLVVHYVRATPNGVASREALSGLSTFCNRFL